MPRYNRTFGYNQEKINESHATAQRRENIDKQCDGFKRGPGAVFF